MDSEILTWLLIAACAAGFGGGAAWQAMRRRAPARTRRNVDKVRIGGQIGFVFGRRVRGTFNIRRLDKTVIGTDINCKKLSLLETRKTFLTELRKE